MAPKLGAGAVDSGLTTTAGGIVPSEVAEGGETDDDSAGDGSKKSGSSAGVLTGNASLPTPTALMFGPTTSAIGKPIDTDRCTRWAELLCDRPSTGDSNAMSAWLLKVLAVSDLEKPLAAKVADTNISPNGIGGDGDKGSDGAAVVPPAGTAKEVMDVASAYTSVTVDNKGSEVPASVADGEDESVAVSDKDRCGDSGPGAVVPRVESLKKRERSNQKRERSDKAAVDPTNEGGEAEAKKAKTSDEKKQTDEAEKDTGASGLLCK